MKRYQSNSSRVHLINPAHWGYTDEECRQDAQVTIAVFGAYQDGADFGHGGVTIYSIPERIASEFMRSTGGVQAQASLIHRGSAACTAEWEVEVKT